MLISETLVEIEISCKRLGSCGATGAAWEPETMQNALLALALALGTRDHAKRSSFNSLGVAYFCNFFFMFQEFEFEFEFAIFDQPN